MKIYIFGYGSLMNQGSLQKTLPGATIEKRAALLGYQRKFNFAAGNYVYLNIIPARNRQVDGVLIRVTEKMLKKLKQREKGYVCKDVTEQIAKPVDGKIFVFRAPDRTCANKKILKSYLETCLRGVPKIKKKKWTQETIMSAAIENDLANPKYKNNGL